MFSCIQPLYSGAEPLENLLGIRSQVDFSGLFIHVD